MSSSSLSLFSEKSPASQTPFLWEDIRQGQAKCNQCTDCFEDVWISFDGSEPTDSIISLAVMILPCFIKSCEVAFSIRFPSPSVIQKPKAAMHRCWVSIFLLF